MIRDQRVLDSEQLRLLVILHYVKSGLSFLSLFFVALNFTMLYTMGRVDSEANHFPFTEFFGVFKWFYFLFAGYAVVMGVLNLVSGFSIRKRKNRPLSLIVAVLNILAVPLGTALGAFSLWVLSRESVVNLYQRET